MNYTVRFPRFDFSKLPRIWARNRAFVYDRNATSLIPTPIEPWLIKICQNAIEQLGSADEQLKEEVKWFIGQESQHFRQHRLFNKAIQDMGYPGLADIEQKLTDELEEFRQDRSLRFLLAYADGFEAMGAVSAQMWFEEFDEFLEGADPNAVSLWGWHLAEEFEHREVMFKLYHALFGRGIWNAIVYGYFYRIYGLWFAMKHLGGYTGQFVKYMIAQDRPNMSAEEKARLKADLETYMTKYKKRMLPKLARNLLPWYNPARKKTPKGIAAYLRRFEPGGDMAKNKPAAS